MWSGRGTGVFLGGRGRGSRTVRERHTLEERYTNDVRMSVVEAAIRHAISDGNHSGFGLAVLGSIKKECKATLDHGAADIEVAIA